MAVGFVAGGGASVVQRSRIGSRTCGLRGGNLNAGRRSAEGRSVVRMVDTKVSEDVGTQNQSKNLSKIGLVGLAVMGQNLALNIADKGFPISVYNRSHYKTDDSIERAQQELENPEIFRGFHDVKDFIASLERPRSIIMLVKAGAPVDATIATLIDLLDEGDMIIDGGNEWYHNTERRSQACAEKNIMYIGMGVSGGEEGARHGPSLMPGGPKRAYEAVEPILKKIAAQVEDGPCVMHIGPGGAGNYVKMIHNGIEYGDMQLIGEAYDILRTVGGLSMGELAETFSEWNDAELKSFLIEITAEIMKVKDDVANDGSYLIEKILDKSGSKGTGMWTMEEAVRRGVPAPTVASSLDARYLSGLKGERLEAEKLLSGPSPSTKSAEEKKQLIADVRKALYASKICSYAQGMNLIGKASEENDWDLDLGNIARIWKGGCIIRAQFLDRIRGAYEKNPKLASLLIDPAFAEELKEAQDSWRRVVCTAVSEGITAPAFSTSLAYYDSYRRGRLPSSQLVQAQRDFFGAHTYRRLDDDKVYHTRWHIDGVTEESQT
eukprot:Plantae.Rhodophyta-Purpureofilum_apyrenoidigerum.ctg5883.p1 GENE.Plantae.Rhodophyta-Purpureofilum_apyrenoidigerum.ctg5883~~Plantae.Rhodophyta-Purpureofilum_apyrenoidigerum.ctg5883.p1  ORF type:complete len:564 (+),score=127.58 Plantae.Rhodophyta-Purpureofilum_apyrenoidigerum.ctg5883:47-1693(+)